MTLLEEIGYKDIKWRDMTPEQLREYERHRYARRKDEINARRRELYRLKKEQMLLEKN